MEKIKVMVNEDDVAIISCPHCRKFKKSSVKEYKECGRRDLKIKCNCGNIFCITLDCRSHYRKSTRILGKSINLSNHREQHDIIIKNISSGGIGFCPFKVHKTHKDDQLLVLFNLDDAMKTPVEAQVTVQSASIDYVGCQFNSTEEFRTKLGFFLTV